MLDLHIKHYFSSGLYAKQMHIPKGYVVGTHKHKFSHISVLGSGSVIVETDNSSKEYTSPACIEILANVEHRITALENVTWFCIHATDEKDEKLIDETLIEK